MQTPPLPNLNPRPVASSPAEGPNLNPRHVASSPAEGRAGTESQPSTRSQFSGGGPGRAKHLSKFDFCELGKFTPCLKFGTPEISPTRIFQPCNVSQTHRKHCVTTLFACRGQWVFNTGGGVTQRGWTHRTSFLLLQIRCVTPPSVGNIRWPWQTSKVVTQCFFWKRGTFVMGRVRTC